MKFKVADSFGNIHLIECDAYEGDELVITFYTKYKAKLIARFVNYSSVIRI